MRPHRTTWVGAAVIIVGLFAILSTAAADLHITPFAGYVFYDDDSVFPVTTPIEDAPYFGGRLGWTFNRWFGIEAAGGYAPSRSDTTDGADLSLWHLSGNVKVSPFGRGPFLFVGTGSGRLESDDYTRKLGLLLEYGAGYDIGLSERLSLRLEGRRIGCTDCENESDETSAWIAGAGLTFSFGGGGGGGSEERDSDGDGIGDHSDRCPDTPVGCRVDVNGCPVDSDADGVCDGVDVCPGTPPGATVDERGCPTDSDGDGVWDGLDKCPDTPKGAKVDRDGCPLELIERETELLDTGMITLRDVNFETAKADILPESYHSLNLVGQILTRWPELQIEIGGHADARGSDDYNLRLSDARVTAVRDYLLAYVRGLDPQRLTARGYGESRPLVPNTSALNMARNRRVEFVVLNRDVLRREVERRREPKN